jgi:hypothetical protein
MNLPAKIEGGYWTRSSEHAGYARNIPRNRAGRLRTLERVRQGFAGVHLVLLEDDKGDRIVATSKKPFKVIA